MPAPTAPGQAAQHESVRGVGGKARDTRTNASGCPAATDLRSELPLRLPRGQPNLAPSRQRNSREQVTKFKRVEGGSGAGVTLKHRRHLTQQLPPEHRRASPPAGARGKPGPCSAPGYSPTSWGARWQERRLRQTPAPHSSSLKWTRECGGGAGGPRSSREPQSTRSLTRGIRREGTDLPGSRERPARSSSPDHAPPLRT